MKLFISLSCVFYLIATMQPALSDTAAENRQWQGRNAELASPSQDSDLVGEPQKAIGWLLVKHAGGTVNSCKASVVSRGYIMVSTYCMSGAINRPPIVSAYLEVRYDSLPKQVKERYKIALSPFNPTEAFGFIILRIEERSAQ